MLLPPAKLGDQPPRLAALGVQRVLQQRNIQRRLLGAAVPGGAAAAGALPHFLQHGGSVNGGRRGLQKKLLGDAENLRPQLQPHLRQPRLPPAAGGLRRGRHQNAQPAAENQPRQGRIIPNAADRHYHHTRRPRRETAHPLALKGDHADHARETQHRRHGNVRHLRQIQPQPSKHRGGESAANCQRACREIPQSKIRRR